MKWNNLNSELQKIGKDTVIALQKSLSDSSSELSKSIQYQFNNNILIIDMNEYGIYVSEGSKPHMPPVDAIKKWAKSKGLNAWAVAKNISKYGTKGNHFLNIKLDYENRIADAGEKDIIKTTDEMFTKNGGKVT